MPGLAALFFLTALLYGAAGFGGGSTYNALLVLAGTDYRAVPVIALACNILVVSGGELAVRPLGPCRLAADLAVVRPLHPLRLARRAAGGRGNGLRRPARGVACSSPGC